MSLEQLSQLLQTYRIPQARLEALNLLELISQVPQAKILAGDFQLNAVQVQQVQHLARLRRQLPLAYLKQAKEFYGLNFHIDQTVLVPRPESEDLINAALRLPTRFQQVYDVGCGSGCLGISYAKTQKTDKVQLNFIDISRQALDIARINCQRHDIQQANFLCQDLRQMESRYFTVGSLILANLPYLDHTLRASYEKRCPELKSEPEQALYAPENGLALYRELFRICQNQTLSLICETLKTQQDDLAELGRKNGFILASQLGLASVFQPVLKSNRAYTRKE